MTAPTRAETARQAVFWGAVAADARARAAELTAALEADARQELERDGVAPTWRIPGLGTIPLCLSSDAVVVDDEHAYLGWVAERYPHQVEEIVRVRPAFDEHLRKTLARRGGPLCDDEGAVIPGLRFVPGGQPRGVQLRPEAAAKEGAAAAARAYLDGMPAPTMEEKTHA